MHSVRSTRNPAPMYALSASRTKRVSQREGLATLARRITKDGRSFLVRLHNDGILVYQQKGYMSLGYTRKLNVALELLRRVNANNEGVAVRAGRRFTVPGHDAPMSEIVVQRTAVNLPTCFRSNEDAAADFFMDLVDCGAITAENLCAFYGGSAVDLRLFELLLHSISLDASKMRWIVVDGFRFATLIDAVKCCTGISYPDAPLRAARNLVLYIKAHYANIS